MKKLIEFFEDDTKMLSMTRLIFFLWGSGVLSAWIYTCINSKILVALPENIIIILGILMSGKVVQSFSENTK